MGQKGSNMNSSFLQLLIDRFNRPDIDALVLMGSFARGSAHQLSDVDLARFTSAHGQGRLNSFKGLIAGQLVVVNDLGPAAVEEIFTKPDMASGYLAGLRSGRPLLDHNNTFARIQERAHAFVWDNHMQQEADRWASKALAEWSEDMCKGLAGLIINDIGRLLSARFASTWGLSRIMQIQRGVLCESGHDFYDKVSSVIGTHSEWVRLRRMAFAIPDEQNHVPTLREQVVAGLKLYVETAHLLEQVIQPTDKPLIEYTMKLIQEGLKENQKLQMRQLYEDE